MQFNNVQNEQVKTVDGRTIWLSRAPCVVYHLLVNMNGKRYVLMGKRGEAKDEGGKPDENGKWALTCGYMDWNESGWEACKREMWEECKIDTHKIIAARKGRVLCPPSIDGIVQPWLTMSDPNGDSTQNVVLHFGLIIEHDDLFYPEGELSEVTEVKWFNVYELPDSEHVAFNHDKRIRQFLENAWRMK